jgi:hypothetical protein
MLRVETSHNRVSSCMGRAWNRSLMSLVETDHGRVSLRTRRTWKEPGHCPISGQTLCVSSGNNATDITHWQHERPCSVRSESISLVAPVRSEVLEWDEIDKFACHVPD